MPLTQEQLREMGKSIMQGEEAIRNAKADLVTAKRAGIDVTDIEAEINKNATALRKIKIAYNPPMPKGK